MSRRGAPFGAQCFTYQGNGLESATAMTMLQLWRLIFQSSSYILTIGTNDHKALWPMDNIPALGHWQQGPHSSPPPPAHSPARCVRGDP